MPYEKALVLLQRRFRFIDGANFGPARAFPQHAGQLGKLRGIAGRVDLDIAIIPIAYPPRQSQRMRGVLHIVTEAHTLHPSPHSIQSC